MKSSAVVIYRWAANSEKLKMITIILLTNLQLRQTEFSGDSCVCSSQHWSGSNAGPGPQGLLTVSVWCLQMWGLLGSSASYMAAQGSKGTCLKKEPGRY